MKPRKKAKKYWETQHGDEIEYSKLEDSHLLNILKWIDKRALNGMMIGFGGGWDAETFFYDEWEIKGQEVYDRYDYSGLFAEAKKRKLIK